MGTVRSSLVFRLPSPLSLLQNRDGLLTKVHIGVASVRSFVFSKSSAKKKLPDLQLLIGRSGVKGSKFLDGIRLHFSLCVLVSQGEIGDALRPQEGDDIAHTVCYGVVVLSVSLERHDLGDQIAFIDLVEPLLSGAHLSEIACGQRVCRQGSVLLRGSGVTEVDSDGVVNADSLCRSLSSALRRQQCGFFDGSRRKRGG
jgi:hypothetical protein